MGSVTRIPESQASAIKSEKASAASLLATAFEDLSKRAVMAVGPNGQTMNVPVAWPHGRSPSNEERAGLSKIVRSINLAMQTPATDDEMAEQLDLLFNSRSLYGADIMGKTRVYTLVLDEVPVAILKTAVDHICRGKADGIGKDLPTTDELLGYCERLQRDVMAKAVMIERMLALPELPAPQEQDEARQKEMREKIQALGSNLRSV